MSEAGERDGKEGRTGEGPGSAGSDPEACDHCGTPALGHAHGPSFLEHQHADSPPLLTAKGLEVGYGRRTMLPAMDFLLRAGEFWALIGRNGSGKTTLIRTLLGLLPPVRGQVRRKRGVGFGYVPQRQDVDPHLPSRARDILLGGRVTGWSFLDPRTLLSGQSAIDRIVGELELGELLDAQFTELSEGQKQRVLMGRALVCDPGVLVLDEPTSAMDIVAERETFALIDRIREERGLGVIVVSHHLAIVASYATDVLFVDREDGTALAGCIADVARNPAFTRRFSAFDCGLPHVESGHGHDEAALHA